MVLMYKIEFVEENRMRNRSMALCVKADKILMIQTYRKNQYIWEIPGGNGSIDVKG